MSRDIGFLVDMLENARRAISYVGDKTRDGFFSDPTLQDAAIYRIGIVGEAANLVSDEMVKSLPQIPWRKIIDMRNFLFHDYHGVELDIVWEVIKNHAPALMATIQSYLDAHGIKPNE